MRCFVIAALLAVLSLGAQEPPKRQTVLLAGVGSEHIATAIDMVADHLKSKGVPVKVVDTASRHHC